jgi:hypothetical protein
VSPPAYGFCSISGDWCPDPTFTSTVAIWRPLHHPPHLSCAVPFVTIDQTLLLASLCLLVFSFYRRYTATPSRSFVIEPMRRCQHSPLEIVSHYQPVERTRRPEKPQARTNLVCTRRQDRVRVEAFA